MEQMVRKGCSVCMIEVTDVINVNGYKSTTNRLRCEMNICCWRLKVSNKVVV